jgi:hypothetical protein
MFERAKTFRRQPMSDAQAARGPGGERAETDAGAELTRAQARALSRCAPLSPAEFKQRRQAAEQGLLSLSSVLDRDTEAHKR